MKYATKPARKASSIGGQVAQQAQDVAADYPEPPARLTANQAEHFNELVRERPPGFWRQMDLVMIAQFCVMWSKYVDVALMVQDEPLQVDGKPNPFYTLHATLFRQCDAMLRRLCLAPSQRIDLPTADNPLAERAALERQAETRALMKSDDLLAKPMH